MLVLSRKSGEKVLVPQYGIISQVNPERECPVVILGPGEDGTVIADSFLDFLRKAREGRI